MPAFAKITLIAFTLLNTVNAINIIVTNDDGFGSIYSRELYQLLNETGHDVYLVAPIENQSGVGGRSGFSNQATLSAATQYDLVPAGAPGYGTDPYDSHIWYYNGTPAACTFFALDHIVPNVAKWPKADLLIAGPNAGSNLGPFLYTLSGTLGATYSAIERGVPAIAISAGNGQQRSYTDVKDMTASGERDPACIIAQLSVDVVNQVIKKGDKSQLIPLGYGLNVNIPTISSLIDKSCIKPIFYHTRMTGGAQVAKAVYDVAKNTFSFGITDAPGANVCINGDCRLPGETGVLATGCNAAVSIFSVDYDAPVGYGKPNIRAQLEPLVTYQKPTRGKPGVNVNSQEIAGPDKDKTVGPTKDRLRFRRH